MPTLSQAAPQQKAERPLLPGQIEAYYRARVAGLTKQGGEYRAPCPIHQGTERNFAVNLKTGVWHCHSACQRGGGYLDLEMALTGVAKTAAFKRIAKLLGIEEETGKAKPQARPVVVESDEYPDENGVPLYRALRWEPGFKGRTKDFTLEAADGGKWKKGTGAMNGVRRLPLNLPAILKAHKVYITEGERKARQLKAWGLVATCNAGGAGKWGSDWAHYFKGRHVVIVPDNDAPGQKHLADVAQKLGSAPASIRRVEIPNGNDVVDWARAGATAKQFLALPELPIGAQAFKTAPRDPWKAPTAKKAPKPQPTPAEPAAAKPEQAPPAPAAAPAPPDKETENNSNSYRFKGSTYDATPDGLLYWGPARDGGRVGRWLTNFTALITADLVMDDGAEQTRALKIMAKRGNHTRTFNVPASNFKAMDWPMEHLGSSAIVFPQFATHAATAIQVMSGEKPELFVYRHTGWRVVDGQHVYVHASGAIGANGPVEVETQLDGGLSKAELPAPADRVATRAAIRASLEMIQCAPHAITLPLYAAIWRSVLGAAPFSIHLYGETGSGKSALAAIVQQHFGARFHQLPEAWASTANALQAATFNAKDFLLTIDEFKPGGSAADHNKWHEKAELVFRAQGNSAGKTRMKADTTLRAAKEPRGLIVSTGEDVPRGNSLRARLVVLEMTRQCMNWTQLTACQEQARKGVYAQVMAGYLQWLAPQMATLPERIATMQAAMRAATVDTQAHRRTPDNLFNLCVGISMFCEYAQAFEAMTKTEANRLIAMTQEVMTESAQVQARQQAQAEPTGLFVEMLKAAVASGRAHYANMSGDVPQPNPAAFGWRLIGEAWQPQGRRIGWLNDDDVYLLPPAAYGVAQEMAAGVHETIPLSLQTLKKRMKERHMLKTTDKARETVTIRKRFSGQDEDVLHTSIPRLYGAEPDKPDNLKRKAAPLSGSGVGL